METFGDVAQLARARHSHCRGPGFDSPHLHQIGYNRVFLYNNEVLTGHWRSWLARFHGMEEVKGSNPLCSTIFMLKIIYIILAFFCFEHLVRDYLQDKGVKNWYTTYGHSW